MAPGGKIALRSTNFGEPQGTSENHPGVGRTDLHTEQGAAVWGTVGSGSVHTACVLLIWSGSHSASSRKRSRAGKMHSGQFPGKILS